MRKSVCGLLASGVLATVSVASAQAPTYLETFEGYSGPFTATGNVGFGASVSSISQFAGGTALAENYGGDLSTTNSAFAGNTAISYSGNADQYALIRGGADFASSLPLPGTTNTVYAAFAVRVNRLDPVIGNNDIELFRLGQTNGQRDIHIGVLDGVLEYVGRNGAQTTILSSTAFDPASGSNWNDGQWRVLAVAVTLDTLAPNSVAKVWTIAAGNGQATLLGQTAPFTAVRNAGINHYGIGAFAAIPTGTANVNVSIDQIGIWDNTSFATESAFLRDVAIFYRGVDPQASAKDWMLYEN